MSKPLSLPPIAMKNSAKSVILRAQLKTAVVEDVKAKVNTSTTELKLDPELTKYVCTVIENSIHNNKKKKINKKALVIDILAEAFTLSAVDKEAISKQIDYVINSHLIKNKSTKIFLGSLAKTVCSVLKVI